jgi:predicted ATPase
MGDNLGRRGSSLVLRSIMRHEPPAASPSIQIVMMTRLAISGYRSLRDIRVPLGALNVVTGANGSGKSSLYRALKLLADIAQGRIIQSLAAEGGLQSTLWAGPEASGPGPGSQKSNQLKARIFRERLWLRHRPRPASAGFAFEILDRSGNQGRKPMDRRAARPGERVCRS